MTTSFPKVGVACYGKRKKTDYTKHKKSTHTKIINEIGSVTSHIDLFCTIALRYTSNM